MEQSDGIQQAQEVRIMAAVITKIARHSIEQRLNAAEVGIGALPFGVLHVIHRGKAETIKDLSEIMMLSPATLVPAVDALEREGLALRRKDPNDRRRTPLALTEKGHALLQRVPAMAPDDHFAAAVLGLSAADRSDLVRLLKAVLRRLPDGEAMVELMERDS